MFSLSGDRARKKNEKKTNRQMLKAQGMLPSEVFDYKTVDFSSFQGGSTGSNAIQTQFQPPRVCIYTLNKYTHKQTHTHI